MKLAILLWSLLFVFSFALGDDGNDDYSINDNNGDIDSDDDNVVQSEWKRFKNRNGKKYSKESKRKGIWEKNRRLIREHNKQYESGLKKEKLELNKFADLTNDEFNQLMNGFKLTKEAKRNKEKYTDYSDRFSSFMYTRQLPTFVNWTAKGYVTPVRNQGNFVQNSSIF